MLIDFAQDAVGTDLRAGVCIVGAGAAGVTLARGLAARGVDTCLLESGGFDHDPVTQSLGVGENVGMPYYDLDDSRLRFFGGTTSIWGGRCAPLDSIDFETRDWVPHSGWPIAREDLEDGYRAAHRDLEIGQFEYGEALWHALATDPPPFDRDRFVTPFWRFDDVRERFSASRAGDLLQHPNVRILIHANAIHLQAAASADCLDHVLIASLAGRQAKVRADTYVLACGGIENARLLLTSTDVEPHGVGNRHDRVGRFFMEHAHGRLGRLHSEKAFDLWSRFRKRFPKPDRHDAHEPSKGVPVAPVLAPAPALQRELGILNTAMTFKLQRDPRRGMPVVQRMYQNLKHQLEPSRRNRNVWHFYRNLAAWYQRRLAVPMTRGLAALPDRRLNVMIRAEQAPNPDSRVRLSESTDALGLARADLDWQFNEQDKHTLRKLAEALDAELVRLGIGRFEPEPWLYEDNLAWPVDPTVGNHPIGGYHHMGTTRMSDDPKAGVVDRNCAVHGYRGLYIAGSSVFPTSGWANPTLTILALAHRLKDHLVSRKVAARLASQRKRIERE